MKTFHFSFLNSFYSVLLSSLILLGIGCQENGDSQGVSLEVGPADLQEVTHLRMTAPFSFKSEVLYEGELEQRPFHISLTIQGDSLVKGEGTFLDKEQVLLAQGNLDRSLETQLALALRSGGESLGNFRAVLKPGMSLEGEWQPTLRSNQVQPMRWLPKEQLVSMPQPISTNGFITIESRELSMKSPDSRCIIQYAYPRFSGFANTEINRKVNQLAGAPNRMEIQSQLANCSVESTEMEESWQQHIQHGYHIHVFTPELLSLSLTQTLQEQRGNLPVSEEYAQLVNLNPQTGQPYEVTEIFAEDFQEPLNSLIQQWWDQRFEGDLSLEVSSISTHQQFEFYPDQMVVRFDPNTVAAFVPKAIRIPLSYDISQELFQEQGPIQRLMDPSN
ncbi:MAG: hypothetical protein AAF399_01030 [Bacteroidota bacterium]